LQVKSIILICVVSIVLLLLGNVYNIQYLEYGGLILLVVGVAYVLITNRSIFSTRYHPPLGN
jgi:hypothetical protein